MDARVAARLGQLAPSEPTAARGCTRSRVATVVVAFVSSSTSVGRAGDEARAVCLVRARRRGSPRATSGSSASSPARGTPPAAGLRDVALSRLEHLSALRRLAVGELEDAAGRVLHRVQRAPEARAAAEPRAAHLGPVSRP